MEFNQEMARSFIEQADPALNSIMHRVVTEYNLPKLVEDLWCLTVEIGI